MGRCGRLYEPKTTVSARFQNPNHIDSPDQAGCLQTPRHVRDFARVSPHGTLILTSFQTFGLAEPITRALAEEQYTTPTPIQAEAIPLVLTGRDLVGIAQTGTGKTAAFALPILDRLAANRKPLATKSPARAGAAPDARTRRPDRRQLPHLRPPPAHPVRARHRRRADGHADARPVNAASTSSSRRPAACSTSCERTRVRLNQVEVLVLDEADRMLDMGFIHDIRRIVAKLPPQRQTLLFSATMPREIAELAAQMLRDPARVAVTPVASTAERVDQRVILRRQAGEARAPGRAAAATRRSSRRSSSRAPSTAPTGS